MVMKSIYKYITVMLCSCLILSIYACKKVEHEISDVIVSFNEATVSSIQIGKKLKVGFLTNNINSFDFSIEKEGTVLFKESVSKTSNEKIIEKQFDIPLEETYLGEAELKVSYQANGQNVVKVHPITFEESNPVMYIVGGSLGAGWEPTNATLMSLYDVESKAKFEIYEYLTAEGGFKFLPTNLDWTGAFGAGSSAGSLLQDEDAGNLLVEQDGFYQIRMDAEALTFEAVKLSMGIIGDATPGGWENDTPMSFTGAKGSYLWSVTLDLVPGEFKFRANNAWTINFGSTDGEIVFDGGNLLVNQAGSYTISLDLTPGAYQVSIEKL